MRLNTLCFLQLCLLVLLASVSAWGSRFDAIKASRTVLRAKENGPDEDALLIEQYRSRLESTYVTYSKKSGGIYDFIQQEKDDKSGKAVDPALPLSLNADWFEPCVEDCEECEIPDDMKLLPDSQQVDVMKFLGIHRAEPLRKKQDWD
jgi:hypothetical protein